MLRSALKMLAMFNWITPSEILVRRVVGGPMYSFKVPEGCGWSGAQIVKMLKREGGVKTFGHMVINDHYMFHVKRGDARDAQYLMKRQGIPIMNKFRDERG